MLDMINYTRMCMIYMHRLLCAYSALFAFIYFCTQLRTHIYNKPGTFARNSFLFCIINIYSGTISVCVCIEIMKGFKQFVLYKRGSDNLLNWINYFSCILDIIMH